MNVEQILEISYTWPIFELVAFFLVHTLCFLLNKKIWDFTFLALQTTVHGVSACIDSENPRF